MDWLDKLIRKAGGYRKVSELTGISEYHLRNIGTGRRTAGAEAVEKLRAFFPRVSQHRWLEARQYRPPARRASAA